jgi:hypothetical protein
MTTPINSHKDWTNKGGHVTLNRLGLGRLRNLEPKPPVQRYERETAGDLIHIDV